MSNYYRILFADFIAENRFGDDNVENVISVEDLEAFLDELDKGSDRS